MPDFPLDPDLLSHVSPSGRTSSSTARSRSTPPILRCAALNVYFNMNLVGTLGRRAARSPTAARENLSNIWTSAGCDRLPDVEFGMGVMDRNEHSTPHDRAFLLCCQMPSATPIRPLRCLSQQRNLPHRARAKSPVGAKTEPTHDKIA